MASDDRLSPRIGATYDVIGDGRLLIHGGFSRYVTAIANPVADMTSSAAFAQVLQTKSKVPESKCSGGSSCSTCPMRGNCSHDE